jgi:hypothetical protein
MNTSTLAPVNQKELETEFYTALQRPENYGVQAEFARQRGDDSDSYVSRMHSPHVPEVKSWLYEAADELDKLCKADVEKTGNLDLADLALSILSRVVARHKARLNAGVRSVERVTFGDARRTFSDLEAVDANYEDGMCSREVLEKAKERHIRTVAMVGVPEKRAEVQIS